MAGLRYVSKSGFAAITFGDGCSTSRPRSFYQFKDGTSGHLVDKDCSNQGGDVATLRFKDTVGTMRCYGEMTMYWGAKVTTSWRVDGPVSGYQCSQTGQTFEIEMAYPPVQTR